MYTLSVKNVNQALAQGLELFSDQTEHMYRRIAPRAGQWTREMRWPVATVYACPQERVLISAERDANPFFHFFEALWMLSGRNDLAWVGRFNSKISQFSDDGNILNGAYGHRWRSHFGGDQLREIVALLRKTPDTRRAVLTMWDPALDLGTESADLPCNTQIYFKIREHTLHMTVCCRSNDVIWGAYGANAVHMSMLQEYVASRVGVAVGTYTQLSDSYHVYEDNPVWLRMKNRSERWADPYTDWKVTPMFTPGMRHWDSDLLQFFELAEQLDLGADQSLFSLGRAARFSHTFFEQVALPLYAAWNWHTLEKNTKAALGAVGACAAMDWRCAATDWLARRLRQ